MFHLSDIRQYQRCKRYFYLENSELHRPRILSRLRSDINTVDLIKGIFRIDKLFVGESNDSTNRFLAVYEEYEWFYKARVQINNLRVKLPLLHKVGDLEFDVYFIILLPNPMATNALLFTQCVKALNDIDFKVRDAYILHVDPEYVRKNKLDLDKLFVVSKHFYNENHTPKERVSWWIKQRISDFTATLDDMEECLAGEMPELIEIGLCSKRPKCEFLDLCYPDHHSDSKIVVGSLVEYAQVRSEKINGVHVDKLALKNWLKEEFKYPLSFIDFEWDTFAIPPFKNMRALDVLPFQFSLDVLNKNLKIEHHDFLETGDTRLRFLRALLKRLSKTGKIIVFNAEGGEQLRLLELKRQFPHYGKKIDKLISRLVDIALPFRNGVVYHPGMDKSYSLKSILKAINGDTYDDLAVKDGREVIAKWREYERNKDDRLRNELLTYCNKDSKSLIDIYDYLKEISE